LGKLGIWAIVIATAFLVGIFPTNVYSETVKECEDRIRADDSLTYAEKTVALKKCDDAEKDYAPYEKDTEVDELVIGFCDDNYEIYKLVGKNEFLKMMVQAGFATQCVRLYADPIWEYEGEDRVEVLINWLKEETQRQIEEKKAPKSSIPDWVRKNARWWSQGAIGDNDFVSGIQYLIQKGIIQIPQTTSPPLASESNEIPAWIKNNADWWSQGLISDDDFVKGIQYLVEQGIIKV